MSDTPIIGTDALTQISRGLMQDLAAQINGSSPLFFHLAKKAGDMKPTLPVYGPERPSGIYGNDCWTISVEFNNKYGENIQETTIRMNSGGYESETAELSRDEARRLARDLLAWVGDE